MEAEVLKNGQNIIRSASVKSLSSNLPELLLGSSGETVRFIQQVLLRLYRSQIILTQIEFNAQFDEKTERAVKEFQIAYNLEYSNNLSKIAVDGIVGKQTWRALGDAIYNGAAGSPLFRITIPPQYDVVSPFSDGLALVINYDDPEDDVGLAYFITKTNNIHLNERDFNFLFFSSFSNERAIVKAKGEEYEFGFIDIYGKLIGNKLDYRYVESFSEGLAYVVENTYDHLDFIGYIDTSGNKKIDLSQLNFYYGLPFSESKAVVFQVDDSVPVGYKMGFINNEGNVIVPAKFDYASSYSDNRALVVTTNENYQIQDIGYLDENGKEVINLKNQFPNIINAGNFVNGLAPVYIEESFDNYSVGYINLEGEIVIPFLYESGWEFSEGYTFVSLGEEHYILNTQGEITVDLSRMGIEYASPFTEGISIVYLSNGKVGAIDYSGQFVIKPTSLWNFDQISVGGYIGIYSYINGKSGYGFNPIIESINEFKQVNSLSSLSKNQFTLQRPFCNPKTANKGLKEKYSNTPSCSTISQKIKLFQTQMFSKKQSIIQLIK